MNRSLTMIALLMVTAVASARVMAPPPIPLSVAGADAVFVGTVSGFGDRMVPAELEKGDDRMMQLAQVMVNDDLLGGVGRRKVTVGFFPSAGRRPGVQLEPKDKALFMVRKHPTRKDTYVAEMYFSAPREKDNPEFMKQVAEAGAAAKLLASPMSGLKSKDAAERYRTAALLIVRYRTARTGAKMEPVPADESKLILEALADADWSGRPASPYLAPLSMFGRLGVTAKDGWTPPMDFKSFGSEASKWLKANAGKYRVQRWALPPAVTAEP